MFSSISKFKFKFNCIFSNSNRISNFYVFPSSLFWAKAHSIPDPSHPSPHLCPIFFPHTAKPHDAAKPLSMHLLCRHPANVLFPFSCSHVLPATINCNRIPSIHGWFLPRYCALKWHHWIYPSRHVGTWFYILRTKIASLFFPFPINSLSILCPTPSGHGHLPWSRAMRFDHNPSP